MSGVCRTKHHLVVVLYMPSAVAEAEAAAMDNAVDVWRLNTASRLQGPVWQWSWPVSRMGDGGLQRSRAKENRPTRGRQDGYVLDFLLAQAARSFARTNSGFSARSFRRFSFLAG